MKTTMNSSEAKDFRVFVRNSVILLLVGIALGLGVAKSYALDLQPIPGMKPMILVDPNDPFNPVVKNQQTISNQIEDINAKMEDNSTNSVGSINNEIKPL